MALLSLPGGVEIHYAWVNPSGADPTIVFLHEALGSIGQWKSFPKQLCTALGCRGLVYEREGYGQSSAFRYERDHHYLHQYAYEELPEVLNGLGIDHPMLYGHSDGGTIALLFGARYPDRPTAIVSEAAHIFVEPETLQGIEPVEALYLNTSFREKLARYHGDKTDAVFYAWYSTWRSEQFREWNIEQDIKTVVAPTLVIQGEKDEYGTANQVDGIMKGIASVKKQRLLIPGCGHHPHLSHTDSVITICRSFFTA